MFADFVISKYQIIITAGSQGLYLPPYKGSTLRGGFGHVFRHICCSQPGGECAGCLLAQACPYAQIFEPAPPPDSEVLKNYSNIPRPFVIEPPMEEKTYYAPGDTMAFQLVLVGQAVQYLPYFVLAFKELGNVGIGKGRLPFTLSDILAVNMITGETISIYNADTNTIVPARCEITLGDLPLYSGADTLILKFVTMTRLKYEHSLTSEIPFHVLIRNLLRRISTLHYFYHGHKTADVDYKTIVAQAEKVRTVRSDLRFEDWERFSHRQNKHMNMGGLVGEVVYQGDLEAFLPLIKLGEIIHVGKGCVFGLGWYDEVKK